MTALGLTNCQVVFSIRDTVFILKDDNDEKQKVEAY